MSDTQHVALYRKYRPNSFADVRNQEHIVSVLEGAIEKKALPHALLFTGSRGTGKTTVARIFADRIGAGDVDIYEIDAASNRGIDDIRELREAVHTLPYKSLYKVYIIDEVHMLTKEAFNALLKTLEEPPAHVIFILATTEADKLLDTITSRCQVFHFRSPSVGALKDTVEEVAVNEGVSMPEEAAELIAIAADGSFRDALGITQKVLMATQHSTIDADHVATIIGAPQSALIMRIVTALHEKDAESALTAVQNGVDAHVDMKLFMRLLLERVRAVILARVGGTLGADALARYSEDEQKTLTQYAEDKTSPLHSHLLLRLLTAAEETGKTYIPQLPLELAIVELCTKEDKKTS